MKKIIFLISILISSNAYSQCIIGGTTLTGTTKAKKVQACEYTIQGMANAMLKSVSGVITPAIAGTDYEPGLIFANGLTRTSNTIRLGGALTQNTNILGVGSYSLTLGSAGSKIDGLNINTNSSVEMSINDYRGYVSHGDTYMQRQLDNLSGTTSGDELSLERARFIYQTPSRFAEVGVDSGGVKVQTGNIYSAYFNTSLLSRIVNLQTPNKSGILVVDSTLSDSLSYYLKFGQGALSNKSVPGNDYDLGWGTSGSKFKTISSKVKDEWKAEANDGLGYDAKLELTPYYYNFQAYDGISLSQFQANATETFIRNDNKYLRVNASGIQLDPGTHFNTSASTTDTSIDVNNRKLHSSNGRTIDYGTCELWDLSGITKVVEWGDGDLEIFNPSGFSTALSASLNTNNREILLPDTNGIAVLNDNITTLTNKTISGTNNTITNIPQSAVTNLAADLSGKQDNITLTTFGTSGAAMLIGNTLNIPDYSAGGGATDITISQTPSSVTVNSSNGLDGTITLANGTNAGVSINNYTTAEQAKLSGIATGATANSPDATLLNRANHTGTQDVSTITGLGALATQSVALVENGGTGAATHTGLVIGNGISAMTSTTTSAGLAGVLTDETGTLGGFMRGAAVKLVADYTNATTTGTEITGLQITSTGTGLVRFEYYLIVQSSVATTGLKFGINHTGTATVLALNLTYPSTGTTATTGIAENIIANITGAIYEASAATTFSTAAPNLGPMAGVAAINTNILMKISGVINVTVSGDLEIYEGSETAATTRVMANSSVIAFGL
jgi:hypothetical protein